MKNFKNIILVAMLFVGLIACNNEQMDVNFTNIKRTSALEDSTSLNAPGYYPLDPACIEDIPFATEDELLYHTDPSVYSTSGVLDYRFARDWAFAELCANIQNYYPTEVLTDLDLPSDISDISLLRFSDSPVIVYDYNNNPYYYEFPLIYRGNRVIGTITVAAQPFSKELIHYVFPATIGYNSFSHTYHRFVGEYPCVYFSNDNSTFYKVEYNEEMQTELHSVSMSLLTTNRYDLFVGKIARLNDVEIDNINSDIEGMEYLDDDDSRYSSIYQYADSLILSSDVLDFWQTKINEHTTPYTDTFAISPEILAKIEENIHEVTASYQGFLSEYMSNRLRLTRWQGYCGPAIMAWLYRGKYEQYHNLYLPIFQDLLSYDISYQDLITGVSWLKYFMQPYSNETGAYPDIVQSHSMNTDNGLFYDIFKYSSETCGTYPLLDWGLRACLPDITNNEYYIRFITAPITWLRAMNQPVVVEGIWGQTHYCGAIGYSYNECWIGKTYMRIFVTDNGYFTEGHNYYPFWSILGGLNYAWVENNN